MKRFLILCLAIGVGAAAGRLFDGVPPAALAVGGPGGGENCASRNGDVNADGSIDISDAVAILSHLFLGDPAQLVPLCKLQGSSGLPDTGQTKCYDISHQAVACDRGTCPGQDGAYATGCPPEGRFVDNGNGTVTDNCTGLMWQKHTADVNGDGQSTDQDFTDWCAALAYCENLGFAGHEDWRLPNIRELQSILNYGNFDPAIDPVFDALSAFHWSSTSFTVVPVYAWYVSFVDGNASYHGDEINASYVLAVRGGS